MSRDTLVAVGAGAVSGLMFVSAATGAAGGVILAYLSQLPLFLAGLALGLAAGLVAGGAGVVVAGIVAGLGGALIFAFANLAPVVLITRQGLLSRPAGAGGGVEWYPPGLLLAWLTGLGLALFAAAAVLFAGAEGGLEGYGRRALEEALARLAADPAGPQVSAFADAAGALVPGLVIASWLVMVVVNGALAQGALARFGWSRRPSPDIAALTLPRWMPGALAAAALAAWLAPGMLGFAGANLTVVLAVPFFFAGLGVVHALVRRHAAGPLVLAVFYMLLVFFGWPVILVAGVGLVDHWAGLRERWNGAGPGKEDE